MQTGEMFDVWVKDKQNSGRKDTDPQYVTHVHYRHYWKASKWKKTVFSYKARWYGRSDTYVYQTILVRKIKICWEVI